MVQSTNEEQPHSSPDPYVEDVISRRQRQLAALSTNLPDPGNRHTLPDLTPAQTQRAIEFLLYFGRKGKLWSDDGQTERTGPKKKVPEACWIDGFNVMRGFRWI
jgi:hypothetical protein